MADPSVSDKSGATAGAHADAVRVGGWQARQDGRAEGESLARRFGEELRLARTAAGMTQQRLGELVGVSQTMVSRVERATQRPSWELAAALTDAVGHRLSLKLFPARSVSLRDSGQLAVAQAIVQDVHPIWHVALEAPVSALDRRAADMLLTGPRELLHIEIETRLVDLQSQLRSAQLKRSAMADRDDRPVRLILALLDTRTNRRTLAQYEELIRTTVPAASREVWRAIRYGDELARDGVLLVKVAAVGRPGPWQQPRPRRVPGTGTATGHNYWVLGTTRSAPNQTAS